MLKSMKPSDRIILRQLALEIQALSHEPRMERLRKRWVSHNDLSCDDPIILLETSGMSQEIIAQDSLLCSEEWVRNVELSLRLRLFQSKYIKDDTVLDNDFCINWIMQKSGWRQQLIETFGIDNNGRQLAHMTQPLLKEPFDLSLISPMQYSVNRIATIQELQFWENIFGDILNVRLRGSFWWTLGMTSDFLRLTGMEQFFLLPKDEPDIFHGIMSFLSDEANRFIDYLERENLLSLNNGNDYVGSGTYGFTNELPSAEYVGKVTTHDLWVLMESQESVSMSPEMFKEFIFPYQKQLAERFGRCYYGCCEPVNNRFHIVQTISNLHTVSVSPWSDLNIAKEMQQRYIFSRKVNPVWISTDNFQEETIRKDIRDTLIATKGLPLEYIMKDVHTIQKDLSRCARWVELVRQEVGQDSSY